MNYSIFVDVLLGIKNSDEWASECAETFGRTGLFQDTYCDVTCEGIPAYRALWDVFASSFTPEQIDLIQWWLYESVEKVIWEDESETIELKTERQLYDYLMTMQASE